MTIPLATFAHLKTAAKLMGWSVVFYLTSGLLVGLALVPTVVRVYQLYTQNINLGSELIVEAARVVLAAAIIVVGRDIPFRRLLSGEEWRRMGNDASNALETRWQAIVIQLGVVLLVVLVFNAGVDWLATTGIDRNMLERVGVDPNNVPRARDAFVFLVKNYPVIPVWVICMLRAVAVIGD